MSLNVSAWSIRNPLPAIIVSMIFVLLGAQSFGVLPITRLPSVDVPIVSVAVAQFGAAPSELNDQVTKPIEDAVSGVGGVRHITSYITDGLSITTVQLQLETDPDRALNEVKDAVTRVRSRLPQNIVEPLVQRVAVVNLPTVTYAAASAGKTPEQLSYFVDDVVKRALQGLKGVGQVERIGGVDREISVALDPDRLQALGLTASTISHWLRGTRVDVAGGRAEIGNRDQVIRTLAAAKTPADIGASVIILPSGQQIRLDDLGTVTDAIAEAKTFARVDGKPVVGFNVLRAKGASDVDVAAAVAKKIDEIRKREPDVDLRLIDSSVDFTLGNYDAAIQTLFEGAALAVIVVLIFLRDWRATLIAAIALPLSIFPAFWAMQLLGFSLNLISFMAITLSTGILVDDSIVEIENIERHMAMGKTPFQASIEAADEIGPAVIAISLTIIAVFVPVSFMGSVAGQFFKQFGITISVQVFFSLLAARFVTPVLAAYFLKPKRHHEPKPDGRMMRGYSRMLEWSVRHHYLTVLFGVVLFVLAILSTRLLPSGFLPVQDTGRSTLSIELPPGSPLAMTQTVTEQIARRLREHPEVKSVFVNGGHMPPATTDVRVASLIINYTSKEERKLTQRQMEIAIGHDLEAVPDIRYWFVDENGQRGVSLIVTGQNANSVRNVAAELAAQMHRIPSITNIVASASLDRPELRIRPRAELAARLGLSTETLSETIRIATIGDVEPALAKMSAGDREIPIRVELDQSIRSDVQRLEQVRVPLPGGGGRNVPLGSIVDGSLEEGPSNIARYDRERQASVAADLVEGTVLSQATAAIDTLPVMKNPPPGITIKPAGDTEALNDLRAGFTGAMRNGLMMVFAVLVLLFGGIFQPITILFSLPLSIGGAFLGLLVTHRPLSVPVFIGMLMLMGIVTKNAIMLVDFTIAAIERGVAREVAAIDAGKKRSRPIIMTTIAMVAGMVPSAFAHGAGGEIRSPMAIAVIGGLIVSTFLSLVFVPAMFLAMDDLSRLCGRLFSPLLSTKARTEPAKPAQAAIHDVPRSLPPVEPRSAT